MLEMMKCYRRPRRRGMYQIHRRKANWIGHILGRRRLLKHIIEVKKEGRIHVVGRRGRRRKKLLDDFKEKRGH